jgi:hypothetical protein
MNALAAAGAGFLLAVLWFDLMFDVQALRGRDEKILPEPVLASIAAYYARVTTAARPMNRLIVAFMLVTLGGIVTEIVGEHVPPAIGWLSLLLAAVPILLVGICTVPNAVRLGARGDPVDGQSALARSICREHLFCLVSIAGLLVLQVASA